MAASATSLDHFGRCYVCALSKTNRDSTSLLQLEHLTPLIAGALDLMARLRRKGSNDEADLEDSDFVDTQAERKWSGNGAMPEPLQTKSRMSPRKKAMKTYERDCGDSEAEDRLQPKTTPKKIGNSKQIRLAPLQANLGSTMSQPSLRLKAPPSVKPESPRKPRAEPKQSASGKLLQSDAGESSDSVPEVDAEESIWCGSDGQSDDSEEDLPSPSQFFKNARKPKEQKPPQNAPSQTSNGSLDKFKKLSIFDSDSDAIGKKRPAKMLQNNQTYSSRPGSSSDKENQSAFLKFSPPRLHSRPHPPNERPMTPPQSPSKSRLQSPCKTKARIPTPPGRPSLDAFWNADAVNDWNEQHSPTKILKSPRKLKFPQNDSEQSSTTSPRKTQSPFKRTKAELEAKKTFAESKHRIADDFLAELDTVVTDGKVRELAASTGGVCFVWSKTLNSTAGRANWRRETTKTRHQDGTTTQKHKHFASIELAEKVIDDEDRLLNVIAHEFCHLANFMVSGIKDQPHGRQFKEWGRKCTAAFAHRGVKVTTKHSFEIEYKYIWQCSNEECGVEFKRHSKSVDPKRHTCGTCRSKLVQIKPVPRKNGDGGNAHGYAAYVKDNFAVVKKSLAGASHKEVLEAVAKKYRAEKASKVSPPADGGLDMDNVTKALEVITIEDD